MPDIIQIKLDLVRMVIYWGPAVLILYGVYKLIIKAGTRAVDQLLPFGKDFITAQQNQAAAMAAQAEATRALNMNLQEFVSRDNSEHREMLLLLKVIAKDIREFEDVKSDHDELYGKGGGHCEG